MPFKRQSAERGVRAITSPFKGLTVPLPADVRSIYRMLVLCAHLNKSRTRCDGLK